MKQYGNSVAVGFAIGILVLLTIGIFMGRDIRYMGGRVVVVPAVAGDVVPPVIDQDAEVPRTGTDLGTLQIVIQTSGTQVHVKRVTVERAGWVAIHEIEGGHVLNALGARRLDAGTHNDIVVELLRATEPGREYAAILYVDNGNKEFEVRGDLPMIDVKGNPLMQTFRTFGGGAGGQ